MLAGAGLFVAGYFGVAAGVRILSFDQHHVISQLGGFIIAATGLTWAIRAR